MLLGFICTILGIIGVVGVFTGNIVLVAIGATANLIENLVGVISREQKNLATMFVAIIIGVIIYLIIGKPFWMGILAGMCFESAILGLISFPTFFIMYKTRRKTKGG